MQVSPVVEEVGRRSVAVASTSLFFLPVRRSTAGAGYAARRFSSKSNNPTRVRPSGLERPGGRKGIARIRMWALFFVPWFLLLGAAVGSAADIQLSQFTDSPDPAVRGGEFTYTLNVENNDADTAVNVVLTLPLPATTAFVSQTGGGIHDGGSPGTVTFALGDLLGTLAGGTVRTVTVTVSSSAATGATLNATATVASDSGDTNAGNNTLSQTTTIEDGADLVLSKSGAPNPVTAGADVTWTIGVTNQGPNDAASVTVTDTLPVNMTFVSASGTGWTCGSAGQTVTCTRASLADGATAPEITIVAQVTGAVTGTLTNTATVAAVTQDPDPNNTITADVTVTTGTDLALAKSVSPDPALSNENAVFTLSPRNNGPFEATGVTVTDTLPPGFTFVSASGSGWSCSEAGGTVACTRAAYAVGATDDIAVTALAPTVAALTAATNVAVVTSATADATPANDTATLDFNVVPDGVDLSITKSKAPNPVAQGATITSTVGVHNNGPREAAPGAITVTDTFDPSMEAYAGFSGTDWSLTDAGATYVTFTYNGTLASGATAPTLRIFTTAVSGTTVTAINTAEVFYSGTPGDWDAANNSATASVVSTYTIISTDLTIAKTTSTLSGDKILGQDEDTVTYTLTVTNNGPGAADGIVVRDELPGYISGQTTVTAARTGGTTAATFNCVTGATVVCTQASGTMAPGETAEFTITATRALHDGGFTNTATVTSTTLGDPDPGNNSASDTITIEPIADVEMQSKLVTPDPVKAGVNATYVLTFRNNGPSAAQNVTVADTFTVGAGDSGFTLISVTPSQGTYAGMAPGSSYGAGNHTLTCSVGTLASGQTETVTVVIRPNWMAGPADRTLDNTAVISTDTWENTAHTDNGNNSQSAALTVTPAEVDILVNKTDSSPAGPDPMGYTPAPVGNDNQIAYRITITNRGPSLATGVAFTDTITPPAGKQITLLRVSDTPFGAASATATCAPPPPQTSGAGTALVTVCTLNQEINPGSTVERYLIFQVETAPESGGDTYSDTVTVSANETDSNAANNSEGETTSVRVRSDLGVTKSASASPVQLREPFLWNITVTNGGPGDSLQTTLTDTLPAGMVYFTPANAAAASAPYNAPPYSSGAVWVTSNAAPTSGICAVSGQVLTANCGMLESGAAATITVPVRITTYSAAYTNSATAATSEVDPDLSDNTGSGSVSVQRSSLAGYVFRDLNNNGVRDAGESGIGAAVQLRLTGTDLYGNTVNTTANSNATTGAFAFSNLSPADASGYTLVETAQPAGFFDGRDAAGTSGGSAAAVGFDEISGIALAANEAATGYLFGELPPNTVAGYVYADAGNDGVWDGTGAGISGATVTLTGTSWGPDGVAGGGDDTAVGPTNAATNAGGAYSFTSLRAGVYTVTEAQPATHLDGKETALYAGCDTSVNDVISNVVIGSFGVTASGLNFGELVPASISGFVYIDTDADAFRDAGETVGVPGVTLTLTGTDDLGQAVNAVVSAGGTGAYSFTNLRPGTYTVTETQPAGLDNTGAQAGVPVSGTPTGASVTPQVISAIPVSDGAAMVSYNFGHSGTVLSGYVYADMDNDGIMDAGEPGIPGVGITLSGDAQLGGSVCDYMASCTVTTNAAGFFSFIEVPASGAGGYTLTEQPQADPPLSGYVDGTETVGTVNGVASGSAGDDLISGIQIALGQVGADYLFGEQAARISGIVYYDADDNGAMNAGDSGLSGVTVTLSGNAANGADISTILPSTTTTTAADGSYDFQGLPASDAGGYTLTETQPPDYASGTNTVGSGGGSAGVDTFTGVPVVKGGTLSGYLFGERTGALGGFVYLDVDNDGVRDGGETGIAGIALALTGESASGAPVNLTATSAADGSYTFTGLFNAGVAGYTVTETQPAGYLDGQLSRGLVNGIADGGCDITVYNRISAIAFDIPNSYTEYDFGELMAASLAGRVYHDADLSLSHDAGEELAGVTIALSGTDDRGAPVNSTAATLPDGTYAFTGLRPSGGAGYILTETQPNGIANFAGNTGTQVGTLSGVVTGNPGAGADTITAILLPQGIDGIGYNFRENASGLSGHVYQDDDDSGSMDAGEVGLPGVTVTLTGTDADGNPVNRSAVSAGDGAYSFLALTSGTYTLTETHPGTYQDGRETSGIPAGTVDNSDFSEDPAFNRIADMLLPEATAGADYLFGERLGNLAGFVYYDGNRNGVMDPTEFGIGNVTLAITGTSEKGLAVSRSTTTDAAGAFLFRNLPRSDNAGYTVTETQPADYTDGLETPGTLGGIAGPPGSSTIRAIVFPGGVSVDGYLFGENRAELTGRVYLDSNRNGILDGGEAGIGGVVMTLSGRDAYGGAVDRTAFTTASGEFFFPEIPSSDGDGYFLVETRPVIYGSGTETVGSAGGFVITDDAVSYISFSGGTGAGGYLFGNLSGSLSGHVYFDRNDNGVMDAGEDAISGTALSLGGTDASGAPVSRSVVTDEMGDYLFSGLPASDPGGYTLTETQPDDYSDGRETPGSLGGTAGPAGSSLIQGIVLPGGGQGTGYLFGENRSGLSGVVYHDRNGNGLMDDGEPGIAGVPVTLTGTDVNGAAVSRSLLTDGTGAFLFTGLPGSDTGGFTLTETQPAAYLDGAETVGTLGGTAGPADIGMSGAAGDGTSRIGGIVLPVNGSGSGYLFGELLGSLSGRVYHDLDHNGRMDDDEPGIAGVPVTLTGSDASGAPVTLTVSTDESGGYLFSDLPASDAAGYQLSEQIPAGYIDGAETPGSLGGTPAGAGTIGDIVVPPGAAAEGYLFGNLTGGVSGSVYLDLNHNGSREGDEPGIEGVTVLLSGADVTGTSVGITAVTDTGGYYSFSGLPAGAYTLTETHPILYQDGLETAGSAGGTADNTAFTPEPPQNRISEIALPAGESAGGYLFGEEEGKSARISGKVWYNNLVADRIRQPGEPGRPEWIVQLLQDGALVAATLTDADGAYAFENVTPGTGYEIRFNHPTNGALYGTPLSQDPDYTDSIIDYSRFTIANLTVRSGADIVEQNLPIDPTGVVYDALTRLPVAGATVTITGPAGFDAGVHLAGGEVNRSQVTDETGFYQFLLLPGMPGGPYTLAVTSPTGYRTGESIFIPSNPEPFDPGPGPGFAAVQPQSGPPSGAEATTYHLTLLLAGDSADVVNNHIPLDPISAGTLSVRKSTPRINVVRGELVPYTVTCTNTLSAPLSHVDLVDHMPPGFKYRPGSATLSGTAAMPEVSGRELVFRDLSFAPGEERQIRLLLTVGAGAAEGEYLNRAWAADGATGTMLSNIASAGVRVTADPIFDCSELIGKVFDDLDGDGCQERGEPGIPGVRLATVRGLLVTTDAEGRYHVACAELPDEELGSNFILKLDERTLPTGYRPTTENPAVVRLTRGKASKLNFGAALGSRESLTMSDQADFPDRADSQSAPAGTAPYEIRVDSVPLDDVKRDVGGAEQRTDTALEKADIQLRYDGLEETPVLNVSVYPDAAALGREAIFTVYSNYRFWIDRGEVRLFASDASPLDAPLAVLPLDDGGQARWTPDAGIGENVRYLVRVYDARGNFDETAPQSLDIARKAAPLGDEEPGPREALVGYGENRLSLRNIPVRGGAVTVSGENIAPGERVLFLEREIPVDGSGRFAARQILPAGSHSVTVAVVDAAGEPKRQFSRRLYIPDDDWFYVALADLTIGQAETTGPIELLSENDERYDDDTYVDGRLAFYLKGKIKGKWLLTASADTRNGPIEDLFSNFDSKDPRYLLRRLDPDRYYPVYGDDATLLEDAPTRGKFYVRIERGDSHAMWGSFQTELPGTDLVQYSRGMYGAGIRYRSGSATPFGLKRGQADLFAGDPGTLGAREEFRGTGGSLYYTRHMDITAGSERVWIEIRDKDSGLVRQTALLTPAQDYDIDYLQGRILLTKALASTADDGELVRTGTLSGNPAYLVVTYEYTPDVTEVENFTAGGRISRWLTDRIQAGVTGYRQGDDAEEQNLLGLDLTFRATERSYLKIEGARSDGTGTAVDSSPAGGYTFNTGTVPDEEADALRAETALDFTDFSSLDARVKAYFESRERGYSSPGRAASEEIDQYGADVAWDINDATRFSLKADARDAESARDAVLSGSLRRAFSENWAVSAGVRHDDRSLQGALAEGDDSLADDGVRTDVGVEVEYVPDSSSDNPDWKLYAFGQATATATGNREENNRIGLGWKKRLNDRFALLGEASGGDGGLGGKLGGDYRVSDRSQFYLNYDLTTDRTDNFYRGRQGSLVSGVRTRYSDSLSVYGEERYAHGEGPSGLVHAYGLDLAATDSWHFGLTGERSDLSEPSVGEYSRTAFGLSAGYSKEKTRYAGNVEWRKDEGDSLGDYTVWLVRNSFGLQTTPEWRAIGEFNFSIADGEDGTGVDTDYTEAVLGYAYRPVENDRLNALFKYTFFYNMPTDAALETRGGEMYAQRSHILAADFLYDLLPSLSVGGKYAYRLGEVRMPESGPWFDSEAHLAVIRLESRFVYSWNIVGEYRQLHVPTAEDRRDGALLAVYRYINRNVKAGVGYNFTDFSDDLTDLSYDNRGFFFNIIGMM